MLSTDTLHALNEAARLAPSADNSQPWRLFWHDQTLSIAYDRERAKSFLDPDFSMLWIALGAMLLNIEITAQTHGLQCEAYLPADDPNDILLQLRFNPSVAEPHPLCEQLPLRCTNRRSYAPTPLPHAFRHNLSNIAGDYPDTKWTFLDDKTELTSLARIVGAFDSLLFAYKPLHAGLFRWIRWNARHLQTTQDGLPIGSLEMSPFEAPGFWMLSHWPFAALFSLFGLNQFFAFRAAGLYRQSAAIGILTIPAPEAPYYIEGGRHFQHLWLLAAKHHVALQPLAGLPLLLRRLQCQDVEALKPNDRQTLAQLYRNFTALVPDCEHRLPLMIVRMGEAPPPSERSPRRPVEELVINEG